MLPNARKGEVWREGQKLLDPSLRPSATMSYRQMIGKYSRVPRRISREPKEIPWPYRSVNRHPSLSCHDVAANDHEAFRENLSYPSHMAMT